MKNTEIIAAVNALAKVPINKIKDDKVKFTLVFDYRILRRAAREVDDERETIVRKFQEDWKEEIAAVQKLRSEGKPVAGYEEFLSSERDANRQIDMMLAEDHPVEGLQKVALEPFIKSIGDAPLCFEDIEKLGCIIDE